MYMYIYIYIYINIYVLPWLHLSGGDDAPGVVSIRVTNWLYHDRRSKYQLESIPKETMMSNLII